MTIKHTVKMLWNWLAANYSDAIKHKSKSSCKVYDQYFFWATAKILSAPLFASVLSLRG